MAGKGEQWQRFERTGADELRVFLSGLKPDRPIRIILGEGWGPDVGELFDELPAGLDLRFLCLRGNRVGDEAILKICCHKALVLSKCVCLEHCGLTDVGLSRLLSSKCFDGLRELNLCNRGGVDSGLRNEISDTSVLALAACPHLSQLESLDLWNTDVSDLGLQALLESKTLNRLGSIYARGTKVTSAGAARLLPLLATRNEGSFGLSLHTDYHVPTVWPGDW